jgi:hypothetical protein
VTRDSVGQCSVRPIVGQIFLAGEESDEWPTLQGDPVANLPAQDRMGCLERVEKGAQRDWSLHLEQELTVHARQRGLVI